VSALPSRSAGGCKAQSDHSQEATNRSLADFRSAPKSSGVAFLKCSRGDDANGSKRR
jgi:hypothetical protein